MSTSPDQHGMLPRRLIEFRRGGQASLGQVDLVPGSRGLDPVLGVWAARCLIKSMNSARVCARSTGTRPMFCAANMRWL